MTATFAANKSGSGLETFAIDAIAVVVATICVAAIPVDLSAAGQAVADSVSTESSSSETALANMSDISDVLLLGTVVLPDQGDALVIIQLGQNGDQQLYRLGDEINRGRLTSILRDGVTLTFADTAVELDLVGGAIEIAVDLPVAGATGDVAEFSEGIRPPLGQTDDGFWRVEQETLDQLAHSAELNKQLNSMGAGGVRINQVRPGGPYEHGDLSPMKHYFNHLLINTDGTRLEFLHRWRGQGVRSF